MASVFISYSCSDQPFVRKLYETLVANQHEVFVDWEGLPVAWMAYHASAAVEWHALSKGARP